MVEKRQSCNCTNGNIIVEDVSQSFEIKNYVKEITKHNIQIYIQNNPYYYEDFCEEHLKEGYFRKKGSMYSVESWSKTDISLEKYGSNNDVSKYLEPPGGLKRWVSIFSLKSVKSNKSSKSSTISKLGIEDLNSFNMCKRNHIRRNAICNPFHIPLTDELKQSLKLTFIPPQNIEKTNYSYLVSKYLRFMRPNKVGFNIQEY